MFYYAIKTFLRSIRKDFPYSVINILGLSIGLTCVVFIFLYVSDELTYDRFHENHKNIYRVATHIKEPDDEYIWVIAQFPFAEKVKEDFPEIVHTCRIGDIGRALFVRDEIRYYEEDVYYADSTVFQIFSFEFVHGSPEKALTKPNTIVISESFANRYFSRENPIGKYVKTEGINYEVTGVMKEFPHDSHIRFDALISRATLPKNIGSWTAFGVYTYILLPDESNAASLQNKINGLYKKYMAELFKGMGISIEYILQPITWIHLHSDSIGEPEPVGDITYIIILGVVAFLIIVIACINYINLSNSRSLRRMREVSIKKILGSSRRMLIMQFLSESFVLTIVAHVLSFVLVVVLFPLYGDIVGKNIGFDFFLKPIFFLGIILLILFVGFLSGGYPAFYISGFMPLDVFKGGWKISFSGFFFRKILIVIQLSVSIGVIIFTWFAYKQIDYLKSKDIGYDKKHIVSINLQDNEALGKYITFKHEMLKNHNITNLTSTSTPFGTKAVKLLFAIETSEGMVEKAINFGFCDYDFFKTLDIQIVKGRAFNEDLPTDTAYSVIVNEALAKRFNWKEPIGKKIQIAFANRPVIAHVIGVSADYHQVGVNNAIESYMLLCRPKNKFLYLKIKETKIKETIQYIENKWIVLFPNLPFEYKFLEDSFNEQFQIADKRNTILSFFSILTIFITSLGLFGLSAYTVEAMKKDIGIRKVLGANNRAIFRKTIAPFVYLAIISSFIAIPCTYLLLEEWLMNFAYRVDLHYQIFLFSTILVIIITVLSISINSYRAANLNPADTLRGD